MTSETAPRLPGSKETRQPTRDGAMLFDAGLMTPEQESLFDPAEWPPLTMIEQTPGGRGSVVFLDDGERRWVLRRYRRGGAVASLLGDRYLWTGEDRTRAFREWRLLKSLEALRLPVPVAVAARYHRTGPFYRAEILTIELPTRLTLAKQLSISALPAGQWRAVGRCIARFHARGVRHADLNAHNVLLGDGHDVFVLDFDRGEIRERGAWEQRVLERLRRSLRKIARDLPGDRYGDADWSELLVGYRSGTAP